MKKLYFFLSLIGMFTLSVGLAQQKSISGTILYETGVLGHQSIQWLYKLKKMNMKIFKTTFYSLLFLRAFVSCEYNDSPLDEDIIGKNTGAVLSTVAVEGGVINKIKSFRIIS